MPSGEPLNKRLQVQSKGFGEQRAAKKKRIVTVRTRFDKFAVINYFFLCGFMANSN